MPASSLPIVHPHSRCPPSPHEWNLGTCGYLEERCRGSVKVGGTKRWFGAPPSRQSRPFPRLASRGAVVSNRNHACVADVAGKTRTSFRPAGRPFRRVQFSIELSRPPRLDRLLHLRFGNLQHLGERAQVRRERDDRANVQVSIGPAVQSRADAWRVGIVDGRVAHSAMNPHRRKGLAIGVKEPGYADNGVWPDRQDQPRLYSALRLHLWG